jgi:alkylhydroperoxidase family enzyme
VDRYADVDTFSSRERLAIEFAERFALAHTDIGSELIDQMREHFSDAEIVELSATIGFCIGIGRIYTVLDIANECPLVH